MLRKIVFYGVLAGIIVGIPMFALVFLSSGHTPGPYGMVIGYLTMLIALSTVFVAIKQHRDGDLGGVIGFWPAFGLGLGISVIASILYVLTWELVVSLAHLDFGRVYADAMIEQEKAKGVTGEALAKFVAEMEQFKIQYANPLFRLPMTFSEIFPVGVLVSLVSAGLLRNRRFLPARR